MITLSGMFICLAMCELCTALALAFSASATRFLWPSANSPFKEVASDVAEATVSCRTTNSRHCMSEVVLIVKALCLDINVQVQDCQ